MKLERCLQQLTGSCLGCNVLEIAQNRVWQDVDVPLTVVAGKVEEEYCPEGTSIQTHHLEQQSQKTLM